MKITCSQESLFYGLQTVQKAISGRTNMPIYSGVLFEAEKDKVHLFATDLEIGIDCYIPVVIEEEGSTVIPIKLAIDLIRKLPQGDIKIESENGISVIKANKNKYKIVGWCGEDFSSFPTIKPIVSIQITQKKLKNTIEKVIFAILKNEQRIFLNGASFKILQNKLEITATDSHRLSYCECEILRIGKSNEEDFQVIVPQKPLIELLKLLDDSNEEVFVNIYIEAKQMVFVLYPEEAKKAIRIHTRLIEGNFPDHRQIIPKEFNTQVTINNEILKKGIERVSLFTEFDAGCINISIKAIQEAIKVENECEMTLNSETENLGKAREKIICYNKGNDIEIVVNAKYILDVLSVIETENTVIKMVNESSPMVIVPEQDKDFLHIVMPIRRE